MLSGVLGEVGFYNFVLDTCETEEIEIPPEEPVCDAKTLVCDPICFTSKFIAGGKNDSIKSERALGALLPTITICRQPNIVQKYCTPGKDGKYCGYWPYG